MVFTTRATFAGLFLAAAAQASYYYDNSTHYTTEVVTAITTYCPGPTTLTYDDKTYTVTEETTLTITDCPCTIKKPVKPTKPVYTTEVVTAITTYCPEPTTLTYNNKTYTVTEPTTYTITDCPCTPEEPEKPAEPTEPEAPEGTEPAVVVNAAGRLAPAGLLIALGAVALL
ncbi:hypothetical protein ACJZ2D_003455 [Fusarium nematophilum]